MQLVGEGNGYKVYYTTWDGKYSVYVSGGALVGTTSSRELAMGYVAGEAQV